MPEAYELPGGDTCLTCGKLWRDHANVVEQEDCRVLYELDKVIEMGTPKESTVLKKGAEIKCGRCEEVIYLASADIPFGAGMGSNLLTYADGKPVEYRATQRCPACETVFISISTRTGRTF